MTSRRFNLDDFLEPEQPVPTAKLTDILTEVQIRVVTGILNGPGDTIAHTNALKDYLRTLKEQLDGKGLLPDYLAYAIIYMKTSLMNAVVPCPNPINN